MTKQVKISFFDVEWDAQTQPLSDTLDEFMALPLQNRWRHDIRLEDARAVMDNGFKIYHMEFAKSREVGPGKLSDAAPLEDVGLAPDQRFGEDTSALYVPSKQWLLIMNNHYGAGPLRMAEYFNALDPGNLNRHFDYKVMPRIDKTAFRRALRSRKFGGIEIAANVGFFERGTGEPITESVSQAVDAAKAMRVTLRFEANEKYKSDRTLNFAAILKLVSRARSSDEVDKMTVKLNDDSLDARDRVIDILEQKVFHHYPDTELQVQGNRYTRGSKEVLLRKSCRAWLKLFG